MRTDIFISNFEPQQQRLWMEEIASEAFNEIPAPAVRPARVPAAPTPRLADVVGGLEEIRGDALIERVPNYNFAAAQAG